MSIHARIVGTESPGLDVHAFWASFFELDGGKVTRQNIIDTHRLSVAEQAELDVFITKYTSLAGSATLEDRLNQQMFSQMLHTISMLAEKGLHGYDTKTVFDNRVSTFGGR